MVRSDSVRTRRSQSADGRYFLRPREAENEQSVADTEGACGGVYDNSRRNSTASTHTMTQPQQTLKFEILNNRMKSKALRRSTASVHEALDIPDTVATTSSMASSGKRPNDLPNIAIKINDDDIDIINAE